MKTFMFVILLGLTQILNAQIQKSGTPWTNLNSHLITTYSKHNISPAPSDWESILQGVEQELKLNIFAWPVDTLIEVFHSDNRIFEDANTEVYLLSIFADSTFSINLIFNSFKLPPGTELYLYNPSKDVIWGAYTDLNNKKSGKLATTPVPGNEIVIELVVDKQRKVFDPQLTIGRVSLDQKNVYGLKSGHFGRSEECNVDINCPIGADWQVVKRSVCKFIVNGNQNSSGALINNTANDGRPLLLTAHHCIENSAMANTSVFYFNYESVDCHGEDGRLDQSVSSAELLATTTQLDFALVELSIAPPESYAPYYAGWDRTQVSFYDSVTCIHHPKGDVKKISKSNRRIATGSFGHRYDDNSHWRILEWDVGTTQPGSSGSPLFSKDAKIIGDLTGGDASCSYNYNDYFQKFWISWDKYPMQDEQLKYWLDPVGLNPLSINGYDPISKGEPIANFSYLPLHPEAGKYLRLQDASSGSPSSWKWTIEDGTPGQTTEKNPLIIFDHPGLKTIQLVISNELGVDTIQQSILIAHRIDFVANQDRVVMGSEVSILAKHDHDYSDMEWQIDEGPLTLRYNDPEITYTYFQSGKSSVQLTIDYPELSYSLYHQNFFRVLDIPLIFKGEKRSPYSELEPLGVIKLGENGIIPGTNSVGYEAFANSFRRNLDTTAMISGVVINVLMLEDELEGTYLKAGIWDSDWTLLRSDSILLNPKSMPFRSTIWFDQPVGMDTLVYAGIFVPTGEGIKFASGLTMTRDESFRNDAWAMKGDSWVPLNQVIGLNSALGIQIETTTLYQDFDSQFKVLIDGESSRITLDLSNLVYEEFELDVFNLEGKKMTATSSHGNSLIDVDVDIPVSGIYLLRLRLDYLFFTKKVLLLKK